MITDSRPRISYWLPDGSEVKIIHDHGDVPQERIGYQLEGGAVVEARRYGEHGWCDKCPPPVLGVPMYNVAVAHVACGDCDRIYRRCSLHGGGKGCGLSLHSHRALYHTRKAVR